MHNMGFQKIPYIIGSIDKAYILFNKIHNVDIVSWCAMIKGYAQKGFSKKAL